MRSSIRVSPGWIGSIKSPSAVVNEFDTLSTSLSPAETETPLRIHADAVLSTTVTDQPFQVVPQGNPEIFDILSRVDQLKLPQGRSLHHPIDTLDVLLMPDALGAFTAERSDHETSA